MPKKLYGNSRNYSRFFFAKKLYDKSRKKRVNEITDYCEYESNMAYERYLDGRAFEDGVSIWLEEDTLCEHLDLDNNKEKEYEY